MRSLGLVLLTVSLSQYASAWTGGHHDIHRDHFHQELRKRSAIVYDGKIADEYDFVVVGGGTAGLAIASRLSEDSNTTVLVLEAGDSGDAVADRINVPLNAYYQGLVGSSYDWNYKTVNQPQAGARQLSWPRGKVLGGSSAINGMYHMRPSKLEVDAWAKLIDGGDKWNWDSMFGVMQDSETFTPPITDVQSKAAIQYVASNHGSKGPIHATYPGYMVPVVGNWTTTLANVGVDVSNDAYGGDGWGAYIATSSINPSNWTRSYSRSGYIDALPPRSNLAVLPNATVTRIVFDSSNKANLTATGVEWATAPGAPRQTVKVKKEVVLAGGTIGSPQVLMLSGVGPSDVLKAANVDVLLDLPGVGQHLQDHISTAVTWKSKTDTTGSVHATQNSPAFMSLVNSAVAYVNITDLLGDFATQFKQQVSDSFASSLASVPSSSDEVKKGFGTIYNTTLNNLLLSPIGQVEILLSLVGTDAITIQAAIQHPFSQGRLYITSNDPFASPAIDPGYLSNNADVVILREGLKLARKIGTTAPLNAAIGDEIIPGTAVQSDQDWETYLANNIGTEYHPASSCAMLPLEQGGVVDANLKVYGLANVRVADASIFPIQLSAHLQAPVYGVAEQAAKLIRANYNGVGWPSTTTNKPTGTSSNAPTQSSGNNNSNNTNGNGASALSSSGFVVLGAAGALASFLL